MSTVKPCGVVGPVDAYTDATREETHMEQQPYGFDQPERDRSDAVPESPQYGYEPRRSYSESLNIQPGSKGLKKRVSLRHAIGIVLLVVGGCMFALPFLHTFGVLHFLGVGPERTSRESFDSTFSIMIMAFFGFGLIVLSKIIGGNRK